MTFIVPYYLHEKTKTCHLLLIGGDTLWEETDPALRLQEDILEPNGLWMDAAGSMPRTTARGSEIWFCSIDPVKTAMDEFYEYDDISLEDAAPVFCWRRFYLTMMEHPPLRLRLGTTEEWIPLGQLLRVLPKST